jgi:hypothetical protein
MLKLTVPAVLLILITQRNGGCGNLITGCIRRRTTSLGKPSEMPAASLTVGELTASRTIAGRFSPN